MKKLLGYRWYYINDKTRIEYGYHLRELGKTYRLQRKIGKNWKYTKSWTYPFLFKQEKIETVIEHLYWKEEQLKKNKIHF